VIATNLLSALCTSLTVGLMSLMICEMTRDRVIALFGSLLFGLTYHIWSNAVITEVYNVNILFLGLSFYLFWRWHRNRTMSKLVATGFLYGVSLGVHFANILLLPAFLLLLLLDSQSERRRNLAIFLLLVAGSIVMVGLTTYLLASNQPPFGTVSPDSLVNVFRYMTAYQHDPLVLRSFDFYTGRVWEHARIFSRGYLIVGIVVGFVGIVWHRQQDAPFFLFMLTAFLIDVVYFTGFGPNDYYTMVAPAYFLFSLWIALGVHCVAVKLNGIGPVIAARGLLVLLAVGPLLFQANERVNYARSDPAQTYVQASFELIPENAVVIAAWNEFTTLVYYQIVHGQRPDLALIVGAKETRRYAHGTVDNYLSFIESVMESRPVVTNKLPVELVEQYDVKPVPGSDDWYTVERKEPPPG